MSEEKILRIAEEKIRRCEEIEKELQNPEVTRDMQRYRSLGKELGALQKIRVLFDECLKLGGALKEAGHILEDESSEGDLKAMAEQEAGELRPKLESLLRDLAEQLTPKDPLNEKDAVVEIRAGTGGVEASLFAADIFRMFTRFASRSDFKVELLSQQTTEAGGVREVIFSVAGAGAYGRFRWESGVHRVQRVPATEASGRIHTSACTVAVLPEAEDVEINIKPEDLKIDVFRSGGPGGQSVNTTDSAVRITHVPTGLVVKCQDEKSQLKNKNKALKILRARLFDLARQEQQKALAKTRKSQVGTGDRSEKIRTYNFPERRVTDHRIGLTLHRLESILDGDMDEIVDALQSRQRELDEV